MKGNVMRYKDVVESKIENSINQIELIQRGLNNRNMSAEEVVNKLKEIHRILSDAHNMVGQETQGLN